MFSGLRTIYGNFPGTFWTLIAATFVDRLGGALLFPFFALYITARFGVGMTEVGFLFAIFAATSLVGGFVGGAVTDRFGRRSMLLFGLVTSGLSSVLMGLVSELALFYGVTIFVGLLSNTGGPAQQAMVADLLPEEKHAEGYGIMRVVANLAVAIGPAIGGFIAAHSYLALFLIDAASSLLTALIVYLVLPETKPEASAAESEESFLETVRGYGIVMRDRLYVGFLVASVITIMVYTQMNSTLSVYLRDVHGVPEQGFGWILSMNAAMVVLFQFAVSRRVKRYPPLLLMLLGSLLYALGFSLYGVVASYPFFLLAMAIITVGEMVIVPVSQALVARFAPSAMRGRYMAFFGFTWTIPVAIGPLAAGVIMDNMAPQLVWYAAGFLGLVAAASYGALHLYAREQISASLPVQVEPAAAN